MQRLAEKILRVYETGTPESKNSVGEFYYDLSASAIVQHNDTLKNIFQDKSPVVNHSLALKIFHELEREAPSALLLKGRLALGMEMYFAAQKENNPIKKNELYKSASEKLKALEVTHPGIIPRTICGNIGMWFFKNGQFDTAGFWLNLLNKTQNNESIMDENQYCLMQNCRATTILKNEDNYLYFCMRLIQKEIPLSKDTFYNYLRMLLAKGKLNRFEMEILTRMYQSGYVLEPYKQQISSKLAKQYLYDKDWFSAIHWADENGCASLKEDINKALDSSKSKLRFIQRQKHQIAAGIMLLLSMFLTTSWMQMNTIPRSAIITIGVFILVVIAFIIRYLLTIKHCFDFLCGMCQLIFGVALLSLLKPISLLNALWVPLQVLCISSLAYFMILLSMPEMFKFVVSSRNAVFNLFSKGGNK